MTDTGAPLHTGAGSTPVPDPTVMTSAALAREIAALREILESRIAGDVGVISAKLQESDKAVILLQNKHDRIPEQIDAKVGQLKALHDERFNGVQLQFRERDTRVKDAAEAGDAALKAALAAAKEQAGDQVKSLKESIDKSEAATTKQIDTQGASINTAAQNLERQIGELKDRLTRIEAGVLGRTSAVVEQRASSGEMRAYAALAITLVLAVLAVITFAVR